MIDNFRDKIEFKIKLKLKLSIIQSQSLDCVNACIFLTVDNSDSDPMKNGLYCRAFNLFNWIKLLTGSVAVKANCIWQREKKNRLHGEAKT